MVVAVSARVVCGLVSIVVSTIVLSLPVAVFQKDYERQTELCAVIGYGVCNLSYAYVLNTLVQYLHSSIKSSRRRPSLRSLREPAPTGGSSADSERSTQRTRKTSSYRSAGPTSSHHSSGAPELTESKIGDDADRAESPGTAAMRTLQRALK